MLGQTGQSAKQHSASLRKQPTDAERVLWQRLRGEQLGAKFRRQHPYLGFVLDFVCLENKLMIEVDGSQHMGAKRDARRDKTLAKGGFRVLRFWNNQVLRETDAVVESIAQVLNELR